MNSKSQKRQRLQAEKKARKRASYTRPGNSAYAQKKRAQGNGKFSPGSPFRSYEVPAKETAF